MIHQLKGQLEELESYAYASGEGTMPSNVLLDRQRVVMGKFMLSLCTVEVFWKNNTKTNVHSIYTLKVVFQSKSKAVASISFLDKVLYLHKK